MNAVITKLVEIQNAIESLDIAMTKGSVDYNGQQLNADEMRKRVQGIPLGISTGIKWHKPGDPAIRQYRVLLSTGETNIRISGEFNGNLPGTAIVEYRNWHDEDWNTFKTDDYQEHIVRRFVEMLDYSEK